VSPAPGRPEIAVDIFIPLVLVLVGLALAIGASDIAVGYTRAIAAALNAPAFLVGVVLVSIGTDLPEIANSIAAHLQDEADVNVGDSVGSTLTQYTFVLGLFPIIIAVIAVSRRQVGVVSALTAGGLGLTAILTADGYLGRLDGILLVGAWVAAIAILARVLGGGEVDEPPEVRVSRIGPQIGVLFLALGVVGFGATVAVRALVDLAETVGVPEFILAFFGASMGTSAPEIAVDLTALSRGAPAIALGDALGSSLVDATLSIGVGPIVAPAAVTARLAVVASLYSLAAVVLVGSVLAWRRRHDWRSAAFCMAAYLFAYVVVIGAD
jgi:cation:H+ antiporter